MSEFLSCIIPSLTLILLGAALIALLAVVVAALIILASSGAGAVTAAAIAALLGPFIAPFLASVLGSILLAFMVCINQDVVVADALPPATTGQGLTTVIGLAVGYGVISLAFKRSPKKT